VSELQSSYGRCTVNPKFLDRFYEIFLASHPAIKPMFAKTDFTKQKAALRNGISMMIMYEGKTQVSKMALDRLGHSHGKQGMNMDPKLYQYWIDSLVKAVKECDQQFSPDLEKQWREAMRKGIDYMVSQG
jgi:hemoglobin-like flavoprotein